MNRSNRNRALFGILAFVFLTIAGAATEVNAQRRDYLTDAEIELVRDAQQIDLRIDVLATAVDRRFAALDVIKSPIKEDSKWGPAPSGTRLELLRDVEGLIQKAIDDIDDVASRNADSEFFPIAVRKMAARCEVFSARLKSLAEATKEDAERGSAAKSFKNCRAVIEAVSQLPKESPNQQKKKKP